MPIVKNLDEKTYFLFFNFLNMRNFKKGFTLVELIIVITIIAILATIAFLTLGDYPMQARDTKRISNVGTIFDKMTILSAEKGFQTFVKESSNDNDQAFPGSWASTPNITNAKANSVYVVEWEVNFKTLGEEKSKFDVSLNGAVQQYKTKAVKWTETIDGNDTTRYCRIVGIKWEKKDAIKSDCPSAVTLTL